MAMACGRSSNTQEPQGIVSLAPNTTDILVGLGLEEQIVGVTRFDMDLAKRRSLPVVGGILNPSVEKIVSLSPRWVIGHWDGKAPHWRAQIEQAGIRVHLCRIVEIKELKTCIQELSQMLDVSPKGAQLLDEIKEVFAPVPDLTSAPTLLMVINHDPLMVATRDSFPARVAHLAGWRTLPEGPGPGYPKLSLEAVAKLRPTLALDLVMGTAQNQSAWREKVRLAHPEIRFAKVDHDHLLQPGPELVKGLRELQRLRVEGRVAP